MTNESPLRQPDLHFLLRYKDNLDGYDTIREHTEVMKKVGYVWLGKFGLGIRPGLVQKANAQVGDGHPPLVYLSSHAKIRYRAVLLSIVGGGESARFRCPEPQSSPSYYANAPCSIWFKLTSIEECSPDVIAGLRLYNSPWIPPAATGMRGLVYVTQVSSRFSSLPCKVTSGKTGGRLNSDLLLDEDFDL